MQFAVEVDVEVDVDVLVIVVVEVDVDVDVVVEVEGLVVQRPQSPGHFVRITRPVSAEPQLG